MILNAAGEIIDLPGGKDAVFVCSTLLPDLAFVAGVMSGETKKIFRLTVLSMLR